MRHAGEGAAARGDAGAAVRLRGVPRGVAAGAQHGHQQARLPRLPQHHRALPPRPLRLLSREVRRPATLLAGIMPACCTCSLMMMMMMLLSMNCLLQEGQAAADPQLRHPVLPPRALRVKIYPACIMIMTDTVKILVVIIYARIRMHG